MDQPTPPLILHLHLKFRWWDDIKAGRKDEELRRKTPHNVRLLTHRAYDEVWVWRGYPRKDQTELCLRYHWRGWLEKTVTHEEFGPEPTDIIAIPLIAPITSGISAN